MYRRAVMFALLLTTSAVLFPALAIGLACLRLTFAAGVLFFWPQYMLAPHGFVAHETGYAQPLLWESGLYCAIAFWLAFAVVFGYLTRKLKFGDVVLAAYPVAALVMVIFHLLIGLFGYSVYLDAI